jgi:hypothetical protein
MVFSEKCSIARVVWALLMGGVMKHQFPWILCSLSFGLLVHCGEAAVTPLSDGGADVSAQGIGPNGGTLRALGGAELVIPPGALTSTTQVTLTPDSDDTPLPDGALRIGPHYRVGPVGVRFARPARLTLPLDAEDRDRLGSDAAGVKVWVRSGAGWSLTEPAATAATTVSIDVSGDVLGAAGVRQVMFQASCGLPGLPSCITPMMLPPVTVAEAPSTTCTGSFCAQIFVDPTEFATLTNVGARPASPQLIAVRDGNVFFVASGLGQSGSGPVFRRSLNGGAIARSTMVPSEFSTLSLISSRNFAIDRDGNAWRGPFRNSFGGRPSAIANFPADARVSVTTTFPNDDIQRHPFDVVRAADGSIRAYRRLVRQIVTAGAPTRFEDLRTEWWTLNPDLSVSGPVTTVGAVSGAIVSVDRMNPDSFWLLGRATPGFGGGSVALLRGDARLVHTNSAGANLGVFDVPIMNDGIAGTGAAGSELCTDPLGCFITHEFSLTARNNELLAPTRPATTGVSIQRFDGAASPVTRTTINLPMPLPRPVIDVVHDSQGGAWLFTRGGNQSQVWHFNRTSNTLSPIALGDATPLGIASDGDDGILVIIARPTFGAGGLMRVRRLIGM